MAPHRKDRRRSLRSLYVWHRWLGVASAILVLWLSLTGIALNHTGALGLDRMRMTAPWLLRAYGMRVEAPRTGFPVAGGWVSHAGGKLFLNALPVADWTGPLLGVAAAADGLVFILGHNEAVWLTPAGEVVERLHGDLAVDLPARVEGKAEPLPPALREQILEAGGGLEVSGSRVLADLHAGRLLGRYGPLLMDLAAAGFIVLALSGLWLWWRFQREQGRRERQRSRHG